MSVVRTDVLQQTREAGIHLIRFQYCDTSALIRAKSTHARGLGDRLHSGIGLAKAMAAICMLDHLPGLVALTCASVNSYRRLQPQSWSSAYTCWGRDNREAAIRVISPFSTDEASSVNAELKACDHTANPYLALRALIAARLDGIARELPLPDPVLVDPASLSEEERAERGVGRLPGSLSAALDALAADTVLCDAFGPALLGAFLAVKRLEISLFGAQDEGFELGQHFYRF